MEEYQIIKFENEKISLDVRVKPDKETVCLTQKQMAVLFNVSTDNIGLHIKNIFKEGELDRSVAEESSVTASDGKKYKTRLYNLDMIISVGFRVKSKNSTIFRKWANTVLKNYLLKGYLVDNQRVLITQENYINLKLEVDSLKTKVYNIEKEINIFQPNEKVFIENQTYTAYLYINKLLREAEKRIILIDGYLDDSSLEFFSNVSQNIKITLITHKVNRISEHILKRFKKEFVNIEIIENKSFHDRFIIVDEAVYSLGTSLNNLGKKLTTIHLMENTNPNDVVTNILNGKISKF